MLNGGTGGNEGDSAHDGDKRSGDECEDERELDLEAIIQAVDDMRRRIPTDEEIALNKSPPTPVDPDSHVVNLLRETLQSFHITQEGNDAAWGKVTRDGAMVREGEGEEEDEYGPLALHAALWRKSSMGQEEEQAVNDLRTLVPAHLIPNISGPSQVLSLREKYKCTNTDEAWGRSWGERGNTADGEEEEESDGAALFRVRRLFVWRGHGQQNVVRRWFVGFRK